MVRNSLMFIPKHNMIKKQCQAKPIGSYIWSKLAYRRYILFEIFVRNYFTVWPQGYFSTFTCCNCPQKCSVCDGLKSAWTSTQQCKLHYSNRLNTSIFLRCLLVQDLWEVMSWSSKRQWPCLMHQLMSTVWPPFVNAVAPGALLPAYQLTPLCSVQKSLCTPVYNMNGFPDSKITGWWSSAANDEWSARHKVLITHAV